MFDIHCSECGKHQLLSPSRIRHLINDDQGIAVIFECWCGALGAYRTGKNAEVGDVRMINGEREEDDEEEDDEVVTLSRPRCLRSRRR